MKLWIARDEDGLLNLFFDEPPYKWIDHDIVTWANDSKNFDVNLDDSLFPEVTFENSPMEVELTLKQADSSREG